VKEILLTIVCCLTALCAWAERPSDPVETPDSLEISLLTCEPHLPIYSLYGHTAIRVRVLPFGQDFVVNYGVFDSSVSNFYLRFAFGLTDYSVGVVPFSFFKYEYSSYGCGVIQQVLDLTASEKARFMMALQENLRPENIEYRYNYFYDNCTTRARDILLNSIERSVIAPPASDSVQTYREMIHAYNEDYPWARWGNDILLGVKSDLNTSQEQRQFLPINLMNDFDKMEIQSSDGTKHPLVKERFYVLEPGTQPTEDSFPLRPRICALLLLGLTIIITLIEWAGKRWLWGYDTLLMMLTGICGLILTAMLFSKHPTVNFNLQLLLLQPLTLIFAIPVARKARKHMIHWWWKAWTVLIVLFIIGSAFQSYAEGMLILALSLLIRCVSRWMLKRRLS